MKRISLHFFYKLGADLKPLYSASQGTSVDDIAYDLYDAEESLAGLLYNNIMPLKTAYEAATELFKIIQDLKAKTGMSHVLTLPEAYSLNDALRKFETILSAELRISDSYFVSQKGGYSTWDLIHRAEILLPDNVIQDMSDTAISDYQNGGKCLAFELPTAAGFHLLRATEAVLRDYYAQCATNKTLNSTATMGTIVSNLENNGGDLKVLGVLKQIVSLHRNPLMHPEDTLTMNQAIVMIGIVTSAIVSMVEDMQAKTLKDVDISSGVPGGTGVPGGISSQTVE